MYRKSQIILEHAEVSDHLILIGHSAGGVIPYRIGLYLEEKYGYQQVQVFAVGCPKFHAAYFLKSEWTDSNQVLRTNSENLVSKIHELYPGN